MENREEIRSFGRMLTAVVVSLILGTIIGVFFTPNLLQDKEQIHVQTYRIYEAQFQADVGLIVNCDESTWSAISQVANSPDVWEMVSQPDQGTFEVGHDKPRYVVRMDWIHPKYETKTVMFSGIVPDDVLCR